MTTAMAAGIVVTFLPLAVPRGVTEPRRPRLLVQPGARRRSGQAGGRCGDGHRAAGLVVPGVLATGAGVLTLALTASPLALVAGSALFGAEFGITRTQR